MNGGSLNILVVSTQFPFPARSGFATRVYQLARQLAQHHNVTLLSYARPDEHAGVARLREQMSVEVVQCDRPSLGAKRASQLLSTASPRPFHCRAVYSHEMQRKIDELCSNHAFDVVQLESSLLCEFAFPAGTGIVLDEHNIEYEVFQRVSRTEHSMARRSFNALEYARFRRFERRWWTRVDGCAVTSEREERIVRSHARASAVAVVPNGVDLEYFRPSASAVQPRTVVFNGILDYRPNLDAARHLVDEVWPLVLRRHPDAQLTIVGRASEADVRRLSRPGVVVTGEVPDLRPYLERAAVVAVPIRMGGGTRLKVVEGLAMGKAMVSTSLGCEGVEVRDGEHLLIADWASAFAEKIVELFDDPALGRELGRAGRALAARNYSWEQAGDRLEALHRRAAGGNRISTSRPRVCIVRQTDMYEPPVQRAAEALVRSGFETEVMCMRNPERPRRAVINGVEITSLPATLGRSGRHRYLVDYAWFFILAASTLAVRHLRRPYAVVQVNTMPDFLVFAAVVPRLLGSRVFLYMNEPMPELAETIFGPGRHTRALKRIEQRALSFADHAYTVTEQLKRRYVDRGASPDRITVVLNGADPNVRFGSWSPSPNGSKRGFTVICHGAIEDRYGQDTLVEAVHLLHEELPDLRLVLTGRGSLVDEVLRMVARYGLDDVVDFHGWVSHERLNDLLHSADVGVVAQKASPYSHLVHTNKMVDYWLFGLPVVASRLRAVSELYDESVIEYYEGDDAHDLARAIRRLHDDPQRRAELTRNGRLAQERNGWAVQRDAYLGPYTSNGKAVA
jgi:glycosyltransferase involved in cell wall biosynthesis